MSKQTTLLHRQRLLSPTASVRVSPLCLGAMTFGSVFSERYGDCSKEAAFDILDYFYDQGGNFIDTANAYQQGQSEEWLGEWMAARGNRDEMVIATKFSTGQGKGKIQTNYAGNSIKNMKLAVDESLKRLKTNYIDLYYVHWWDWTTSIEEIMQGLNDLVRLGKVHYLGISDCPAWIVSKANEYARRTGLRQFSVYQGFWNASLRDFEREIIPMCKAEGMGLAPYGTLGQGRFQTEQGYIEREKNNEGRKFVVTSERDKQVSKVLEKLAKAKKPADSPTTTQDLLNIAVAYVMLKAPYVFPIIGCRTVAQIKGSVEGLGTTLTDEEIAEIDRAYPFDHGFPHTFLSGTLFQPSVTPRGSYGTDDLWLLKMTGEYDFVQPEKAIRYDSSQSGSELPCLQFIKAADC